MATETSGPNLVGIIAEIVVAVISLYLVQHLLEWQIPFVTSSWTLWLPVATTVITANAIIRSFMHIMPEPRSKGVFEILSILTSIYSTYWLLIIFPFDFSAVNLLFLNGLIRLALLISLFALTLSAIVTLFKIIFGHTSTKTS